MSKDPRSDEAILDGVVPGVSYLTLGGEAYVVKEPPNFRARAIRKAIHEYDEERSALDESDPGQMELMEVFLDRCIKNFSDEIEGDWDRIERTATDTERLEAMAVIREAVTVPFQQAAVKVKKTGNRAARRSVAKPKKKAAGRRRSTS